MSSVDFWISIICIGFGLAVFFYLLHGAFIKANSKLGELDHGEIRKAITIAFTAIYIVMLPYYFFNAYMPAAANVAKNNATEIVTTWIKSDQLLTYNATANTVPAMAINDLLRNFLYVYIFIIIFYFTSRTIDGYTEVKRIEKLRGSNPVGIVLTQYARGRIDESTMKNQIEELNKIAASDTAAQKVITKLEGP